MKNTEKKVSFIKRITSFLFSPFLGGRSNKKNNKPHNFEVNDVKSNEVKTFNETKGNVNNTLIIEPTLFDGLKTPSNEVIKKSEDITL